MSDKQIIPDGSYEDRMKAKNPNPAGCLLCAWGNDLPEGEYCRACGCTNYTNMHEILKPRLIEKSKG